MAAATETDLSSWTFDTRLPDGTSISVRPIRAADAAALVAFHDHLSPETVYKRFFGPHPHLSADEVRRFTTVDFEDRFAMIALHRGDLVGVGRFDLLPGVDSAELAFVVADALQGHGIGTLLLKLLVVIAQSRGIRRLHADTLTTNQTMLDVFLAVGFKVTGWMDGGIVHVELQISPAG